MTVTAKVLIEPKLAEDVDTVQYTASGADAIIDKFTVTNTGSSTATIAVNLVTNLGAVSSSNRIISFRNIGVNETYTCPELIGHVLKDADYISTAASIAETLTIRASGREITV